MFVYILLVTCQLATSRQLGQCTTLRAFLKALPIFWLTYLIFGDWGLVTALLFSAAGDITLEIERKQSFMIGIGFFFWAHLAYISLLSPFSLSPSSWVIIPLTLYSGLILRLLWQSLGSLRLPVLAYVIVILGMGIAAVIHSPFSPIVVLGACIFIFSDSAIAIDKFIRPIPQRNYVVMISYYLAQGLLVFGLR